MLIFKIKIKSKKGTTWINHTWQNLFHFVDKLYKINPINLGLVYLNDLEK